MTVSVLIALLAAAVFFAVLISANPRTADLILGLLGLVFSLGAAWLLGKGVTACKRRINDLATAAHAAAQLNDHVSDAVAHFNGAIVHVKMGQYAEAVAHFDVAIRLDPGMANAYVGRVNAYSAMGQVDRVIAEYTAAIQLDATNTLAYCARATAYNAIGRFDLSIADSDEAIRLAPRLYLGYDARGFGYLQRGRFNWILKWIAIAWWLASLGFVRQGAHVLHMRTGCRADFEQAIADFTTAICLNPRSLDCYQGRAEAYRSLGEHAKAAADDAVVRAGLAQDASSS